MRHKKYVPPTEGLQVCPKDKIPVAGLDKTAEWEDQGEFGGLGNGGKTLPDTAGAAACDTCLS